MMEKVNVVVTPAVRTVHLGQDAMYSCKAFNLLPTQDVIYSWQLQGGSGSRESGRDEVGNSGRTLRIVDTSKADNNTDVSCNVLMRRSGELFGSDTATLVVLPALPSTEPPSSTRAVTEIPTTAEKTTLLVSTETLKAIDTTTQAPSTAVKESTPLTSSTALPVTTERPTTLKVTTRIAPLPSSMPSDTHEGPTQNMVDEQSAGIVAPAVIGGIVFLLILLVTGVFLMRRSRRKSRSGDIENGTPTKKSDHHMYEFVLPNSVDSVDGANSDGDEENHNKKRPGNNHSNRDSLKTYSRGTAPDSVTRYAKAVPKRDRIVRGGGHGGKPRREPVLTLSMNSLYEETTPTFVVTDGYVDELPQDKHKKCAVVRGDDLTDEEDEDQYVTLAHNPQTQESVKL